MPRNPFNPGPPFWSGFTAFCANEAALFALDKLDVITTKNFWLSLISSSFVGGVVYGREKVAELKEDRDDERRATAGDAAGPARSSPGPPR
jgi:hypothetical protein